MALKPTHQLKGGTHQDICAWHFATDASRPMWVVRDFHNLGDGNLSHRGGAVVHVGDWICVDLEKHVALVLTNEEFNLCFTELVPVSKPT